MKKVRINKGKHGTCDDCLKIHRKSCLVWFKGKFLCRMCILAKNRKKGYMPYADHVKEYKNKIKVLTKKNN